MPWARWKSIGHVVARARGPRHDHALQPLHRLRRLRLRHVLPGRVRVVRASATPAGPRSASLRCWPRLRAARCSRSTPHASGHGLSSALLVVPCCVLVGEIVAWVGGLLRHVGVRHLRGRGALSQCLRGRPHRHGPGIARRAPGAGEPRLRRHPRLRARRARGQGHQGHHPPRRLGAQRHAVRGAGARGHRPLPHGEALPPRRRPRGVGHGQHRAVCATTTGSLAT